MQSSDSWPGLLIGQGLSEILAVCAIVAIILTIKWIEGIINAMLVDGSK